MNETRNEKEERKTERKRRTKDGTSQFDSCHYTKIVNNKLQVSSSKFKFPSSKCIVYKAVLIVVRKVVCQEEAQHRFCYVNLLLLKNNIFFKLIEHTRRASFVLCEFISIKKN